MPSSIRVFPSGKKAFTLIELLVVISILGLLSSVVLAGVQGARDRARIARGMIFADNIYQTNGDRLETMWRFNGDVNDQSGSGRNLRLVFGATYTTDTYSGNGSAVSLNGVNQMACLQEAVPCDEAIPSFVTDQITVSAWIKADPNQDGETEPVILSHADNFGYNFILRLSQGKLDVTGFDPDGAASLESEGPNLLDGKWHHVAMTSRSGVTNGTFLYVDGAKVRVYVGGQYQDGGTLTIGTGAHAFLIGSSNGSHHFKGSIDDVQIYSQALGE